MTGAYPPPDRHLVGAAEVAVLGAPVASGGVFLGEELSGAPVAAELFRDRPVMVATIDPLLAALLAFRSVGVGARVVSSATDQRPWLVLRRFTARDRGTVDTSPVTSLESEEPGFHRPLLAVENVDPTMGAPLRRGTSWTTTMLLLPDFSPRALSSARSAALTLLPRLDLATATTVCPFLGLRGDAPERIAELPDGHLAAITGGVITVLRNRLTAVEVRLLTALTAAMS
jgi:hypothetical protein